VQGPTVVGYLRAATAGAPRRAALSRVLSDYCNRHELTLGTVLIEAEGRPGNGDPAFRAIVSSLASAGVYGVVMPSMVHLGPKPIAGLRRQLLTASGVRLLLARRDCIGFT
jgi:hypothetical protein